MAVLIDPRIARTVARRVAGRSPFDRSYLLDALRRDLDDAVPRSEELVAEFSGIPPPPPVSWDLIDRRSWAETNITGLVTMLGPLTEKLGRRADSWPAPARIAQRTFVSAEVGALLGYVARRVLGQYDVIVPEGADVSPRPRRRGAADGASLYFVGPNMIETERRSSFVPADFALWVSLHEVTHRFQFAGVPWLRDRFFGLVTSYLSSIDLDAGGLARRLATAARRLASGKLPPEERSPVYLLASEDQRAALNDIQALMAVVEGHGNFVMDAIGARVIPSFRRMRSLFNRRRMQTSAVQKIVNHAIGLEMKMRQYELGQAFCEHIAGEIGPDGLGALWESPDNLPSMKELKEPESWLKRVA